MLVFAEPSLTLAVGENLSDRGDGVEKTLKFPKHQRGRLCLGSFVTGNPKLLDLIMDHRDDDTGMTHVTVGLAGRALSILRKSFAPEVLRRNTLVSYAGPATLKIGDRELGDYGIALGDVQLSNVRHRPTTWRGELSDPQPNGMIAVTGPIRQG